MRAAARGALRHIAPRSVIGVGTGRTVTFFIEELAESGLAPVAAVSTSMDTRHKLEHVGIPVIDVSEVEELEVYVDGADELDPLGRMIKGAGGALTMEKIVASAARLFVCIADESKLVTRLGGRARIPLEVLRPATRLVQNRIGTLHGTAEIRAGFITEWGNPILDVAGLDLSDPTSLEWELDVIPGVVECGLFSARRADIAVIGLAQGGERHIAFAAGADGRR